MEKRYISFVATFIFCLLIVSPSYVAGGTVGGWYGIVGHSGIQELYGEAINSESYGLLGTQEGYDPGYWEDFWDLHLRSEIEIQNSHGTVTAHSQTPSSVGAWMEYGELSVDLADSARAMAWTNTQSIYSPDNAQTADIEFYRDLNFNLSEGFSGNINIYFGIWENEISSGNLMLDERDGWAISQLDFKGTQYSLLKQAYTASSDPDPTIWSLNLEAGQDYLLFTYMEAEVIPEPATLLMLGVGVLKIRRRK